MTTICNVGNSVVANHFDETAFPLSWLIFLKVNFHSIHELGFGTNHSESDYHLLFRILAWPMQKAFSTLLFPRAKIECHSWIKRLPQLPVSEWFLTVVDSSNFIHLWLSYWHYVAFFNYIHYSSDVNLFGLRMNPRETSFLLEFVCSVSLWLTFSSPFCSLPGKHCLTDRV